MLTAACLRISVKLMPHAASLRCNVLRLMNTAAAASSIGAAAELSSSATVASRTLLVNSGSHTMIDWFSACAGQHGRDPLGKLASQACHSQGEISPQNVRLDSIAYEPRLDVLTIMYLAKALMIGPSFLELVVWNQAAITPAAPAKRSSVTTPSTVLPWTNTGSETARGEQLCFRRRKGACQAPVKATGPPSFR
jgi:hypothetical protein